MEFQDHGDNTGVVAHLIRDHKLGGCDKAKEFLMVTDFFLHLEQSHGAVKSLWNYKIKNACKKEVKPPLDCAGVTILDATQASYELQSATVSMPKLPVPDAQIAVPPPLPLPAHLSENFPAPKSNEQSVNHYDMADHCHSAAVTLGSRIPDERLDWLKLDGVVSTRRRRTSLPLPVSAKKGGWPSPATPACDQTVTMESSAKEDCTKSPASLQRSFSAAEERKSESLHVCSTCQRSFARRTILTNHERTHTGEKPFSCTFEGCSQTFAQQGDKTRHEQAQHTEKTFICGSSQDKGPSWGCGKKFRRKDGLLEHHSKTKKGKQCLTDRDKLAELGRLSNEDSLAFS
jgi:uncharacterized Zn-finger protein